MDSSLIFKKIQRSTGRNPCFYIQCTPVQILELSKMGAEIDKHDIDDATKDVKNGKMSLNNYSFHMKHNSQLKTLWDEYLKKDSQKQNQKMY